MNKYSLTAVLVMCMSACTTTQDYGRADRSPAPVEDKVIIDGSVMPLPEKPAYQSEQLEASPRVSPVVSQLLVKAEQYRSAQNWQSAASSLERALRIEPRNALLWSRLADVRYSQKNWQQAIQFAAKSNTLVQGNRTLRRQNWYLMVNSYESLGNVEAAQKYRLKLQNQ